MHGRITRPLSLLCGGYTDVTSTKPRERGAGPSRGTSPGRSAGEVQQGLDPVIADVVESFCVVELFLPDYLGRALPCSRPSRAYTWFYANWGYEESKLSLALA